jgi:hypothetical protein
LMQFITRPSIPSVWQTYRWWRVSSKLWGCYMYTSLPKKLWKKILLTLIWQRYHPRESDRKSTRRTVTCLIPCCWMKPRAIGRALYLSIELSRRNFVLKIHLLSTILLRVVEEQVSTSLISLLLVLSWWRHFGLHHLISDFSPTTPDKLQTVPPPSYKHTNLFISFSQQGRNPIVDPQITPQTLQPGRRRRGLPFSDPWSGRCRPDHRPSLELRRGPVLDMAGVPHLHSNPRVGAASRFFAAWYQGRICASRFPLQPSCQRRRPPLT